MTAPEAAALLDLIIARAPALAAAGVRGRVELGEIAFSVTGPEPVVPAAQSRADDERPDPLQDPATYGLRGGERIARRSRTPILEPGE